MATRFWRAREIEGRNFKPVTSSNLRRVRYAENVLQVMFQSGSIYEYTGVPRKVFNQLMRAPSKGQFFYYRIRCEYPYRRVV